MIENIFDGLGLPLCKTALPVRKTYGAVKTGAPSDPLVDSSGQIKQPKGELSPQDRSTRIITSTIDSFMRKEAYVNPDTLVGRYGLPIYKRMGNDDQIKAVMAMRKTAIMAAPWVLKPYSESSQDKKVRDFVYWALTDGLQGMSFYDILESMLTGMDYGFAVGECDWYVPSFGEYKNSWALRMLKDIDPEYIGFRIDEYGDLRPDDGIEFTPRSGTKVGIPPEKFLIYTHNKHFGNFYGISEFKAAYRSWYAKDVIIRFYASFLEKHGTPMTLIKHPRGYPLPMLEELDNFLNNLSHALGVRVSEDISVEFKSGMREGGSGEPYMNAISLHNTMISRSLLSSDLAGFTEMKYGNRALGESQAKPWIWAIGVFRDKLVNRIINYQLIPRMVDYNFGEVNGYPRVEFQEVEKEDIKTMADVFETLIGAKVIDNKLADDVNFMRRKIGLDPIKILPAERDEEEAIKISGDDKTVGEGEVVADPTAEDDSNNGKKAADEPVEKTDDKTKEKNKEKMSKKQELSNIGIEHIDFAGIDGTIARSLISLSETLYIYGAEHQQTLEKVYADEKKAFSTKLQLPKVAEFRVCIEDILLNMYGTGVIDLCNEVKVLLNKEWRVPESRDYLVLRKHANKIVRESIYRMTNLVEAGSHKAFYTMKEQVLKNSGISAIMEIYNLGRKRAILEAGTDLIPAFQVETRPDDARTELCGMAQIPVFMALAPYLEAFLPPFHMGCRSILKGVTMAEFTAKNLLCLTDDIKEYAKFALKFAKMMPKQYFNQNRKFIDAAPNAKSDVLISVNLYKNGQNKK